MHQAREALKSGIISEDQIIEANERYDTTLDNPGICIACGHEQDGAEPDAENYECEACGEAKVFGAQQLAIIAL